MDRKKILFISDTHFAPSPLAKNRYSILTAVRNYLKKDNAIGCVIHGGDLCDHKDFHPSTLVNEVVNGLADIAEVLEPRQSAMFILQGNHDFVVGSKDYYWDFLNHMFDGTINFCSHPSYRVLNGVKIALYPHGTLRTPFHTIEYVKRQGGADLAICHELFAGVLDSNGRPLTKGEDIQDYYNNIGVDSKTELFAGDIHVTQMVERIQYIGAQYNTSFGYTNEPVALVYDTVTRDKKWIDIFAEGDIPADRRPPTLHTVVIKTEHDITDRIKITDKMKQHDLIKIRVIVEESHVDELNGLRIGSRRHADSLGLAVHAVETKILTKNRDKPFATLADADSKTPLDVYNEFCDKNNIQDSVRGLGEKIVRHHS